MNSSEEPQQKYFVIGMGNDIYIIDKNNIVLHLLKDWAGHKIGTNLTLMISDNNFGYKIRRELSVAEYIACRLSRKLDGVDIID